MGMKAQEPLQIASIDELATYLSANHAAYIQVAGEDELYYLTDCNEHYWRIQRTDELNEKGHYVDASELVPTVEEFMILPFNGLGGVADVFDKATFYASVKE